MLLLLVLAAAALPDVFAVGVVVSPRPEACVALLKSAGRTRAAKLGESAFGGRVVAVEPGRVVLEFDAGRLELRIGPGEAARAPAALATSLETAPAGPGAPPAFEHSLARADLERRLAAELPRILAESALAPVVEDGRVRGLRLVRVAAGTLLTDLGLRPGDVLLSLNDTATDSLQALLALWPRLQGEAQIRALVLRDGRPLSLLLSLR